MDNESEIEYLKGRMYALENICVALFRALPPVTPGALAE